MKYILRNNYSNTIIPCDSWNELADTCESIGIDVSTVVKAKREGRETISKWELLTEDDAKSNHIFNMWKKQQEENRVLVIGDLHEPFCLDGYLEFCKGIYDKYKCNKVVFLGDVIDGHSFSAHKASNKSCGVNSELELAIAKIKKWHDTFPHAKVCHGNHESRLRVGNYKDLIIPDKVFKPINELLEAPTWDFAPEHIIDDVKYHHGIARNPKQEAQNDCRSVVAGHRHSEGYIHYFADSKGGIRFGMQVGAALDSNSYAAAYAKGSKPQHTNCGVVINGQGILEYMKLGEDE